MLSGGRSRRCSLSAPIRRRGFVAMTQRAIVSSGLTTTERFPCLARTRSTVGAFRLQRRPSARSTPSPTPSTAIISTTPPSADLLRALGQPDHAPLTSTPSNSLPTPRRRSSSDTASTGPDRYEVRAMGPDDATDPTQRLSGEIIELVGVDHGSYGRRPGCAPRTGRAGGVPRDPARLRREMDRAAEALGLIWHRDATHRPASRDERLRKLHRPSGELRLGLP
jgi:hypothetical protein